MCFVRQIFFEILIVFLVPKQNIEQSGEIVMFNSLNDCFKKSSNRSKIANDFILQFRCLGTTSFSEKVPAKRNSFREIEQYILWGLCDAYSARSRWEVCRIYSRFISDSFVHNSIQNFAIQLFFSTFISLFDCVSCFFRIFLRNSSNSPI